MAGTAQLLRGLRGALAFSLAMCGLLYVPLTWHWPLVGDASLIHYIAFLIERGWAPYRQLGDMNMPGSFLIELAAMDVFGPGALAWRIFDFAVCLGGAISVSAICGRRNWLPGLFAASLFVLIHGRDGLAQGGQRDLTMAVCLIGATACLLAVARGGSIVAALGFGLLSGIAVTIKPTAALLTFVEALLVWRALAAQRRTGPVCVARAAVLAGAAWFVAPVVCVIFLVREHAVSAFVAGLHGVVPYYASLGHRGLSYVLVHSISPIEPLVVVWAIVLGLRRPRLQDYLVPGHQVLVAGVLFGVANCVVQHRALPYYRYPLLAFLLPLIALDLADAVETGGRGVSQRAGRGLALAGLVFGGLFLAPQSVVLIHRYRWFQTEMLDSLEHTLEQLGGAKLSGRVQCVDSVSGCGTVLYRMRLEPATGVLSDFLLFGNTTDRRAPEDVPVIRQTRAELQSAFAVRLPEVIVVTSHLHMTGPEEYGKLARWPGLGEILATRYALSTEWRPVRRERWWSREEYPAGYRIYVLRH